MKIELNIQELRQITNLLESKIRDLSFFLIDDTDDWTKLDKDTIKKQIEINKHLFYKIKAIDNIQEFKK